MDVQGGLHHDDELDLERRRVRIVGQWWVFVRFLPRCWRLFVVVVVAIGGSAMAMARLALTPALPLVAGSFSDVSTQAPGRTNAAGLGSAARRPLSISYQTRRLSTRALSAPKGKFVLMM